MKTKENVSGKPDNLKRTAAFKVGRRSHESLEGVCTLVWFRQEIPRAYLQQSHHLASPQHQWHCHLLLQSKHTASIALYALHHFHCLNYSQLLAMLPFLLPISYQQPFQITHNFSVVKTLQHFLHIYFCTLQNIISLE